MPKPINEKDREARRQAQAAKFIELANKRVNKAVKAILQISNLGNRNSYFSSQEQRTRIVNALRVATDSVEDAFVGKSQGNSAFKL